MRIVFASMAALCATLLSPGAAMAGMEEPAVEPREAPGVVISFQGGLVGENIGRVLDAVAKSGVPIATEPVTVEPNDSLCRILARRGFPRDCALIARAVDQLNPETKLIGRSLQIGETLRLPKLRFESYAAVENYAVTHSRKLEYAKTIAKNYQGVKIEENDASYSIEYKSYELYIPMQSDDDVLNLTTKLYAMRFDNVFIDALTKAEKPARAFSFDSDKVRDLCDSDEVRSRNFSYADLADSDADAAEVVRLGLPPAPRKVSIWLIDTKLEKSPNLWPAYGDAKPQPTWRCRWQKFVIGKHHATHLAGIIASQQKEFGFKGVSEAVELNNFVWVAPDAAGNLVRSDSDRARQLARILGRKRHDFPLPVWLAATNFDPLIEGGPEKRLDEENENLRTNGSILLGTIVRNRPLFIVAAGQQSDSNLPGVELEPRLNASPQNLGDYDNVVVVTACVDCDRGEERLMPSANRSRRGEYMVQVAAPGGENLPGWISEGEIGASGGTSQAAAYVAGVAASMIGNFPENYRTPDAVKLRLQTISRPFTAKDGRQNRDSEKLTAGVVDPLLALLDPSKNWVKDGRGWRQVKIKSWPAAGIYFEKDTGSRTVSFEDRHVLRIFRNPFGPTKKWSVYVDRFELDSTNLFASVDRLDLVSPQSGAALALCDGTELKLDSVNDAIFRMGAATDACEDVVSGRLTP